MPNLNNDIHYVKFMRGSVAAWEILNITPERISNDTLYFIYENESTSTDGKLYLGTKLISGAEENNYTININDLEGLYIDDESLSDKQILVYNETTQRWENTSLANIINTAVGVMSGATAAAAGTSGLVPVPQAGDNNKFLSGDGTWKTVNIPTFDPNIFATNNNQVSLLDFASAPVGTVPIKTNNGIEWTNFSIGAITRQITTLNDLQTLIANNTISDSVIYMIPKANATDNDNTYDEYMYVSNHLERIGTLGDVNLNDYVTVNTFNQTVGTINNILYDTTLQNVVSPGLISRVSYLETHVGNLDNLQLSNNNTTLVEEINTINDNLDELTMRLQWHELNTTT